MLLIPSGNLVTGKILRVITGDGVGATKRTKEF